MEHMEGSYSGVLRISVRLRVLNGLCSPLGRNSAERLHKVCRVYFYVMCVYSLLGVPGAHSKVRKAEGDIILFSPECF